MELKGKAREAFEKWFDDYSQKHHQKEWLDNDSYLDEVYLPDEIMYALIIEWLDSVGIYVETYVISDDGIINFSFNISGIEIIDHEFAYHTRQQATEKAIEMAIKIFNGNH